MKSKIILMRSLLLFLFTPLLLAQEPKAPESSFVRVLPVGDMPPWKEQIKNGVRVQIPPPPGAVPIEKATIPVNGGKGETLSLVLGKMTKYFELDGELPKVQLFENELMQDNPWVDATNSPGSTALMLLMQDPRQSKPSWNHPISKMIADDLASFPLESLRFVNVSGATIIVRIEKEPAFSLAPGAVVVKGSKPGKHTLLIGTAGAGEKPKRIYKNRITMKPGERTGIFMYRTSSTAADSAPKVRFFPEKPSIPKRK